MRFAISLLAFRPGQIGGAETYVRQILRFLPAVAGEDELLLVMPRGLAGALETHGWRQVLLDLSASAVVTARIAEAFTPWRARAVERAIAGLGLDAILFPQQSIFAKRVAVPAVLTVHDLQHLYHPANFAPFDRAFRAAIYPASLRRARRIIAISSFTRRTLIERAGVAASKIETIPLGFTPGDGKALRPLDALPGPYLFYPAATFPHKNHATLFRTYATLKKRDPAVEPLVLTGARTAQWPKLARLIRRLGMQEHIRHLGFLPWSELRRVYAGASTILFPSLFEGFGLPVLEAVESGKKIVVSRLEVFDEVGVPKQAQIDFADAEQLLRALQLAGPTRLEKQPQSWEETARATLAVLRRAADDAG